MESLARQPPARRASRALALGLAIAGAVLCVFPFAGFLGAFAVFLAGRDREWRWGLRGISIGLGALGAASALGWVVVFCMPEKPVPYAPCPRVSWWDGTSDRVETDFVASSLYAWAERREVQPAPYLLSRNGEYELRIVNAEAAIDHVDSLEILLVDHGRDVEVLPTVDSALVAVKDARPPLTAVDLSGEAVREYLVAKDGESQSGAIVKGDDGEPRWRWTLEFRRPWTAHALLLIRGRGTQLAETAFAQYLATMGQGMGPFMEIVAKDREEDCACNLVALADELTLLHMPLVITVAPGTAAASVHSIGPWGPEAMHAFVLPVDLPPDDGKGRVTVRLESTPRFWHIDEVALAPDTGAEIEPVVLRPRSAVRGAYGDEDAEDVTELLAKGDRRRVTVAHGDVLEASFEEPPPVPGLVRSAFIAYRGYYEVPVGGRPLINVPAVLAHRLGLRSLPRFAAELP